MKKAKKPTKFQRRAYSLVVLKDIANLGHEINACANAIFRLRDEALEYGCGDDREVRAALDYAVRDVAPCVSLRDVGRRLESVWLDRGRRLLEKWRST